MKKNEAKLQGSHGAASIKEEPDKGHHHSEEHGHQGHGHHHGHAHEHSSQDRHAHEHLHGDNAHAHASKKGEVILTVRACSGLSGDMMLAGLSSMAELTQKELDALTEELKLPALARCLTIEPRSVNHIAGIGCRIELPHEHAHRTLADIRQIIDDSLMPAEAKELSLKAFTLLAEAEAAVHGTALEDVSFHEVGALDSILDTCLACRVFTILKPSRFVSSPLPLADGVIRCAHGLVPAPAPAVLRMLQGIPVVNFKGEGETVTPTALCLLKALGAEFGGWPDMTVDRTVISYGGKVFHDAPNGAVWAIGR